MSSTHVSNASSKPLPGIIGDGSIPAGIIVAGDIAQGGSFTQNNNGVTNTFRGRMYAGDYNDIHGSPFTIDPDGTVSVGYTDGPILALLPTGQVDSNSSATIGAAYRANVTSGSGGDFFSGFDQTAGALTLYLHGDGSITSAKGIGLHGHAAQVNPRTIPQTTIDAIVDANAKAAVQACANALDDIGALTIT